MIVLATLIAGMSSVHGMQIMYRGPAQIIDGDSIIVDGRETRLLCIDAVEYHQSCRDGEGAEYPCGERAKAAMVAFTEGKEIVCRGTKKDVYDRQLATCKNGREDIARYLVLEGWAISTCSDYSGNERDARNHKRGIWQGTFTLPRQWRRQNPRPK